MINPTLKLNPELFDEAGRIVSRGKVLEVPIRKGFGEGLLAAGEADSRVVGLCADLTESTQMHLFAKKFPGRFVEVGVAEQNLAAVASGMAAAGKIPFISSYAVFSPGRNWEQIRTTICYNNVPVKIAGSHAGVSVGPDGGSHQALEDIALMRVLPRMTVLSPCDAIEAKKATLAAAALPGPVYIRLAREKTPVITTEETPFEIGKPQIMFQPIAGRPEVGIIATGSLLYEALRAAWELERDKISVAVLNVATIKPLDDKMIAAFAKLSGRLVTVEEHQTAGGLGSAVAECTAKYHPVPIAFIGVADQFGQSGKPEELLEEYGLNTPKIVTVARTLLRRK